MSGQNPLLSDTSFDRNEYVSQQAHQLHKLITKNSHVGYLDIRILLYPENKTLLENRGFSFKEIGDGVTRIYFPNARPNTEVPETILNCGDGVCAKPPTNIPIPEAARDRLISMQSGRYVRLGLDHITPESS